MTAPASPTLRRALVGASILVLLAILGMVAFRAARPGPHNQDASKHGPRIVALSPAIAVTLRDLGLSDRIVGRHVYDLALEPSVPVCGDQTTLDFEALIRAEPTDIITEWGAREIPGRLRDLARSRGWALHDYTQLTLDAVVETTRRLGASFAPPGSEQLSSLVARMQGAWATPHAPINAGRILLLESIDPPAAVGPGSFHQDILERVGGTPAITTGKAYMTLDLEDVLRLAPDGIVVLSPRPPRTSAAAPPSPDELLARLGRIASLNIPAVKGNRIALIDDPYCLLPSSALLVYSEQLETILKRWAATPR